MSDKIVSVEDLNEKFVNAVSDDTPIAVQTPTGNVVSGDTRKVGTTQKKDYELTFYLPVEEGMDTSKLTLVMGGAAYRVTVKANQRFISGRIGRKVRNYASKVAVAFTQFREDGSTDVYTVEDYFKLLEVFDDEVIEACEKLVVETLGVSEALIPYITDESLMEAVGQILTNNPSFFQVN